MDLSPPAGHEEVPSSYRDYFGNLGFFCAIFRDITPIAARQPFGLEFRDFWLGFLAWFSAFRLQRRATAEEESCPKLVPGKGFHCNCRSRFIGKMPRVTPVAA